MENSPKPVFTQGTCIAELIDSTLNTFTSCAVYGFLCVCKTLFFQGHCSLLFLFPFIINVQFATAGVNYNIDNW